MHLKQKSFILYFTFIVCVCFSNFVFAFSEVKKEKIEIGPMIMHHILDDYQYEITEGLVIPLPIIVYSKTDGLKIFSSSSIFYINFYKIYK